MFRSAACVSLVITALASSAIPAHAQYRYPRGYSGWNGWGASTVGGNHAMGMGMYAAGAGAYNEQTAQARSQNVNTAMQINDYSYAINQRNTKNYYDRMNKKVKDSKSATDSVYSRVHDHPEPQDIRDGDALNVVLDELINPSVYTQVIQKAKDPVASGLVKNIAFEFAPQMVVISLDDLSSRGVPDVLLTTPSFQSDRTALRNLVHKAHEESAERGAQVSPETLAQLRVAIKALKTKVDSELRVGTTDREQADNFLKALYGLTKMLQSPDVAAFLKGLDEQPTTTLGQVITFMHSFHLRFGPSKTADQGNAYDQLYPMLVQIRDQSGAPVQAPGGSMPPLQDPSKVTQYFSGMDYSHFEPQPSPHAPPPPRGRDPLSRSTGIATFHLSLGGTDAPGPPDVDPPVKSGPAPPDGDGRTRSGQARPGPRADHVFAVSTSPSSDPAELAIQNRQDDRSGPRSVPSQVVEFAGIAADP